MAFDTDVANPGAWALQYRGRGLQVVPARKPSNGQWKIPLVAWKTFQDDLIPEPQFLRWYGSNGQFVAHASMGMITGRASGNIFVIDFDTYKNTDAMNWWRGLLAVHNNGIEPETWTQITGGGGRQLFFRAPPAWIAPTNRTSKNIDVRGQGGFVMLPPSPHQSGQCYAWTPGRAPWECECAEAPPWLLKAVTELVEKHRGAPAPEAPSEFNEFGARVDGREEEMRDFVWARIIDLYRQCPIKPSDLAGMQEAYEAYEVAIAPRDPSTRHLAKSTRLEREGRGLSAFREKWLYALKKWDSEVAAAGREERAPAALPAAPPVDPKAIRTVDFFTLMTEEVEEEPDYIEPAFAGPGGFVLIAGPPKAQKSFLLQEILVAAATGGKFLDGVFHVPRPLRVFWLQAEMNRKLLRKRSRVFQLLTTQEKSRLQDNLIVSERFYMILNADGVQTAIKVIRGAFPKEPPDIIAVDPLANVFDKENENDNAQIMQFLTGRLEAVRQAINPMAGLILVHHSTKKTAEDMARDPFVAIRGASALRGYYDSAIIIFKESEDTKARRVHFELRGGESPPPMTVELHNGRFRQESQIEITKPLAHQILVEIDRAWQAGRPYSVYPQTKRERRFAALELSRQFTMSIKKIDHMLGEWMQNGIIATEIRNSDSKIRGIKVLSWLYGGHTEV